MQNGLRSFFSYIKDAVKINETKKQGSLKILFTIIFFISLGFSFLIFNISQKPLFKEFFSQNLTSDEIVKMLNEGNLSFLNSFLTILPDYLTILLIQLATGVIISILIIVYMRQLIIHHIPELSPMKLAPIMWKAFLIQLLIFPAMAISMIDVTDILPLLAYSLFNAVFVFAIFFMLEGERSITASLKKSFDMYKTRFVKLFFIVLIFELFSMVVLVILPTFFDVFQRPFLTRAVSEYINTFLVFFEIRYLFFIYKDLNHPEKMVNSNND